MDERLEKALEFASFRHALGLEKKRLQEKLKSDLTIAQNGGIFFIDRNFIVFLNTIDPDSEGESAVVLDDRNVPILIDNLTEFKKFVTETYFRVINQFYLDYESLKKKRSPGSLINL